MNIQVKESLDSLLSKISYLPLSKIKIVKKAFLFANSNHENQLRRSGVPYIIHPIEVSIILASQKLPYEVIVAGLLHDIVEDTEVTNADVHRLFGETVSRLVDGVTKVSELGDRNRSANSNRSTNKHETLKKLYLTIANNDMAIIVKIADRLHNMRTLGFLPKNKQKRIASETMNIYSPIAARFGMYKMKSELEDLSFKYLDPEKYLEIQEMVKKNYSSYQTAINKFINNVKRLLFESNHKCRVTFRFKHLYSIYRKMYYLGLHFGDISDVFALRIIVKNLPECYSVLGVLHQNYRPIQNKFYDYIASPKLNTYQSLHTTVLHQGTYIEFQIRTEKMDDAANYGVASHWQYKEVVYGNKKLSSESSPKLQFNSRLAKNIQKSGSQNSLTKNYIQQFQNDIFTQIVVPLTPKGDPVEMPSGGTVLDFAYEIHTELGNNFAAAVVNNKNVSINYRLKSGDICKIIRSEEPKVDANWMTIAKTSHARSCIHKFLRRKPLSFKGEFSNKIIRISNQIEEELKNPKYKGNLVDNERLNSRLRRLGYKNVMDLYDKINHNLFTVNETIQIFYLRKRKNNWKDLLDLAQKREVKTENKEIITIEQTVDYNSINLAKCCYPILGDSIIGHKSDKSITVHRTECTVFNKLPNKKLVSCRWNNEVAKERHYFVKLLIECHDRKALLFEIVQITHNLAIEVEDIRVEMDYKVNLKKINLLLKVHNKSTIDRIINSIDKLYDIHSVTRPTI